MKPPVECVTCGKEISADDASHHLVVCHQAKLLEARKRYNRDGLQTIAGKSYAGDRAHASKWRTKGPKHPVTVKHER